jgi:hypothetical protein
LDLLPDNRSSHVPCARCHYDLHVCRSSCCPECGLNVSESYDSRRLIYASMTALLSVRISASLAMLYWLIVFGQAIVSAINQGLRSVFLEVSILIAFVSGLALTQAYILLSSSFAKRVFAGALAAFGFLSAFFNLKKELLGTSYGWPLSSIRFHDEIVMALTMCSVLGYFVMLSELLVRARRRLQALLALASGPCLIIPIAMTGMMAWGIAAVVTTVGAVLALVTAAATIITIERAIADHKICWAHTI